MKQNNSKWTQFELYCNNKCTKSITYIKQIIYFNITIVSSECFYKNMHKLYYDSADYVTCNYYSATNIQLTNESKSS